MRRNKQHTLLLLVTILMTTVSTFAQTGVNSPYSRYGYGMLGDNSFGVGRSMGGIGYGLRAGRQINAMNPASYAAMDSLTFLFDMGVSTQAVWMNEGDLSETQMDGGLEYVALQFPLGKHMAASVGMLPFSSVGYAYTYPIEYSGATSDSNAAGTGVSTGEGGLTQIYAGMGADLFEGFSLGFNASYLFGSLLYTETAYSTATSNYSFFTEQMRVRDFRIQFGAQYTHRINAKNQFTLGAVYTPSKKLLGEATIVDLGLDSSGEALSSDSAIINLKDSYALPQSIGAGFTYVYDNRITVGGDVTYQDWSAVPYNGFTGVLNNRLKVALGGEYRPEPSRTYASNMAYRAGINYNRSYLKVKDSSFNEFSVSCGVGLPMRNDKSLLNLSLEYVNSMPTNRNLIDESYLRLSVSLTFNELWFFKRQFE